MSKAVDSFEAELVLGPKKSERKAWMVACAVCFIAIVEACVIVAQQPLRRTEVYNMLIDKTTGQAERIVQVQPVGLSEEKAIKEALLVAYVNDRESFIRAGIQERLESVVRRTEGSAKKSFINLWTDTETNEDYPPRVYGEGVEITVKVKNINFLNQSVAQVRFTKKLTHPIQGSQEGAFVANIEFEFDPKKERELNLVWENPLGFSITSYVVSAETLGSLK